MFQESVWFLLGALSTLCVFFLVFYISKRDETYNLLFAIGCLITIIRTVSYNLIAVIPADSPYRALNVAVDHLTFIWGPYTYVLLADSLFPDKDRRTMKRVFLAVAAGISAFILFVPIRVFFYAAAYDYIIAAFLAYAFYLCFLALIHRREYAIPVFVANCIFVGGIALDVLNGSGVIRWPIGEVFGFAYLLYAAILAAVLAHRYMQSDRKRLRAQLDFLQAQIRPHFLYNTLGTISAYCQTDPVKASDLLNYLSTYLRGKFRDGSEQMICLNDEIELVKAYLTIEQARFQERIAVVYDIQEDCNILIPSLILQPLVENAVKHGVLSRAEGGTILLSVRRAGDRIEITVKDDGEGMSRQALRDVLEGRGGGIGMRNTNERLKRYYRTEIRAESTPGAGTEVTIAIPCAGGSVEA